MSHLNSLKRKLTLAFRVKYEYDQYEYLKVTDSKETILYDRTTYSNL